MSAVKRVAFIQIALKKCQLEYGVSPCTAAVGVTGEQPCFNSRATCQDIANISEADEIICFAKPSSNIPISIPCIENIASISYEPPKLDLGKSIGIRSTLNVSFKDHRSPDTDASGDKYIIARDYDPYERGTYWGKFRARHPFVRGQSIWLIQGTSDQDINDMDKRRFVIEKVKGPDANGNFSISAKDILKLAQGDRAQAPVASRGYLQSALTAGATAVTLSPSGIGSLYPSSGFAAIGGAEIVSFNRSGDSFTLGRGQYNTEAIAHDAESRFQLCLHYSGQRPSEIFNDLLTNYTSIDASLIPLADWNNESDNQIGRVYSTLVAQPTPVVQLINELLEQTASTMWWDERAELLRWSVLKNPSSDAFVFNDDIIQGGTFSIDDQPEKRVSQVWFFYGQINPLINLDEQRNYRSSLVTVDLESEINYGQPAYKEIFSRWILGDARDTAQTISNLILQRYSTPPRKLGFKLLQNSLPLEVFLGASYQVENMFLQDFTGGNLRLPMQVSSIIPDDASITVQAEEITFNEITPPDPNVVNLYPTDGTIRYSVYDAVVAQTGEAPTADSVVNIYIESGFRIGGTTTGGAIWIAGTWPAGSIINIYNNGYIVGSGGDGGNGGSVESGVVTSTNNIKFTNPNNGDNGGDAILIFKTYFSGTINVFNEGVIGGGGGGQGGGVSAFVYLDGSPNDAWAQIAGHGGSGGAGYPAGVGAPSGSWSNIYGRTYDSPAQSGQPGGLTTGGNQSAPNFDSDGPYGSNNAQITVSASLLSNKGGNLGQNGDAGNGVGQTSSGGTVSAFLISVASIGGAAGAAVGTFGAGTVTVNISGSGQVLGAVES